MRSDGMNFVKGFLSAAVIAAMVWAVVLLVSCTAALVPSGIPGCPNRTAWSDSAQRCLPKVTR